MRTRTYYSGGLGLSPYAVCRAMLGREDWIRVHPDWWRIELVHSCRGAIARACIALGLGNGDEVLAPAYHCGSEIDALIAHGLDVKLYDVASDAQIDGNRILSAISSRTRAVFIVRFFGRQSELLDVMVECASRGIQVIEDCAHQLWNTGEREHRMPAPDAIVYSLTKHLPVPDGGVLCLRERASNLPGLVRPTRMSVVRGCLPLFKRWMIRTIDNTVIGEPAGKCAGYTWRPVSDSDLDRGMPSGYFFRRATMSIAASGLTCQVAARSVGSAIVRARRANYEALAAALRGVAAGARPLIPELPVDAYPLVFPLIVDDSSTWAAALRARRVHAIAWWRGEHPAVDLESFPIARRLKQSVIALPVHQQLTVHHMQYMAECVRAVAAGIKAPTNSGDNRETANVCHASAPNVVA